VHLAPKIKYRPLDAQTPRLPPRARARYVARCSTCCATRTSIGHSN